MGNCQQLKAPVPDVAGPQAPGNKSLDFLEAPFSVPLRMWVGNAWGLGGKGEVTGVKEALPGLPRDLTPNLQNYRGGDNIDDRDEDS